MAAVLDEALREHLRAVLRSRPEAVVIFAADHGNVHHHCDQRRCTRRTVCEAYRSDGEVCYV